MNTREDLLDDVGALESDRKRISLAGVPCGGVEGRVRLYHRGGREVEVAVALRAPGRDLFNHARRLPHRPPTDPGFGGNDQTAVDAGGGEYFDGDIGRKAVFIPVHHEGAEIRAHTEFHRKFAILL